MALQVSKIGGGLACGLLCAAQAAAQWSPDPNMNNAVAVAPDLQLVPVVASDGGGGGIFFWRSERFDGGTGTFVYDLLAQRIDASGVALWPAGGLTIVAATVLPSSTATLPPIAAVPDGSGGAIVAWNDVRAGADIYAQRVTGAGFTLWAAGGAAVTTAPDVQQRPNLVSDGLSGAIVTWQDRRPGSSGADVYAQRLSSMGLAMWTLDGVRVCGAPNDQLLPELAPDGSGGAVVAWSDTRAGTGDVYVQRLDAAGNVLWAVDGVALSAAPGNQTRPVIVPDASGGAIVAWSDDRNAGDPDIYARRVDGAGVPQWTPDGAQVASVADAGFPRIAEDGSGGAIVVWSDARNATADLFAQRLDSSGTTLWTANGAPVSLGPAAQALPRIVPDGAGGAVIGWEDTRSGTIDVYAQRLNASGAALWAIDGRPVSTAALDQHRIGLAPDGAGGGLFVWQDGRNAGTSFDIYAAHVDGSGGLPVTLERFTIE